MERTFTYTVSEEYENSKLDTLLRGHYHMSGSLIKELKRTDGGLVINGSPAKTTDILHNGDIAVITLRESASENIEPVELPFGIVYEDEDILIANKPPGMPTHISQGNYRNTLSNTVMHLFHSRGESLVFRAVNRLDKDTSGLLCIAKNKYAHAMLCGELGKKSVSRKYLAILCGHVGSGTIDAPIGRAHDSVIKRTVTPDGDHAVTRYRTISEFGPYSLAELILETGRTHQIRVHMAHLGAPLLGDWLYGTEDKALFPRQALHSFFLSLTHPVTGQPLEFNCEMPDDMAIFIAAWKNE